MHLIFWTLEISKTRKIVGRKEIYVLVHHVNNRWRWCCGCFNFRQRTLELGYQSSLFIQNFFSLVLVLIFKITLAGWNERFIAFLPTFKIHFKTIVWEVYCIISVSEWMHRLEVSSNSHSFGYLWKDHIEYKLAL